MNLFLFFLKNKKIYYFLEINCNEESLYANRSLCYKNLGKYKLGLYDINRAIEICPRNIKYLKRLMNIQMMYGNFGDCHMIINKCINLEPREPEHKKDLENIEKAIKDYESLDEIINKKDFQKAEEISERLLKECSEFLSLKIIYIKILLENLKLNEAVNFISNKISQEERTDEIDYYLALAFYYDGQ